MRLIVFTLLLAVPLCAQQPRGGQFKTWDKNADGTEDPVVPFAQGEEIHAALEKAGVESHLLAVEGAGHGFRSPEVDQRVKDFLARHLLGKKVEVSGGPVKGESRR